MFFLSFKKISTATRCPCVESFSNIMCQIVSKQILSKQIMCQNKLVCQNKLGVVSKQIRCLCRWVLGKSVVVRYQTFFQVFGNESISCLQLNFIFLFMLKHDLLFAFTCVFCQKFQRITGIDFAQVINALLGCLIHIHRRALFSLILHHFMTSLIGWFIAATSKKRKI